MEEYDIEKNDYEIAFYKKRTMLPHRLEGPALETLNGDKEWWVNGEPHRDDGPAIEYANGKKEWWVNGVRLSPEKENIMNVWWENKKSIP